MTTAEEKIETILEQLTYTKGVLGTVICRKDGTLLRDTFDSLDRNVASGYS